MRYALHADTPTTRLASYIIEATSRDPQQAQEQLRAGVAAAFAAFTHDFGPPLMRGDITWRPRFLSD